MKDKLKNIGKGTFDSLSVRNFRLYFIGQAVSLCGTWMQTIGQAWLVLQMTGSGTELGLVVACQFVPVLFLGPWGGLIADRFAKRKILYFTQSVSAVLALLLGVLVLTHVATLWMVYVLAFASGLVNVLDNPARQTFIMELVGKEKITNAVSLTSVQVNLARVIGPALGGIFIASLGLAPLFILNGLSFLAVIYALFLMDEKLFSKTPPVEKIDGQIKAGLKYVRSNHVLFDTLIMMSIIGTLTYEFTVSLPLMAEFAFHGNAETYALLTVAMGAGSVFGGLYTANIKKMSQKKLAASALFFGLSVLLAAVMPNLPLEITALIIVGFFSIIFLSGGNVVLQLESSPTMRGRVMSLWAVAFLGSTPIGGPVIGWVGEYFGSRFTLVLGGIAAIMAAYMGVRSIQKRNPSSTKVLPS